MKPLLLAAPILLVLAACAPGDDGHAPPAEPAAFFEALGGLCGQAFAGELVSNDEADADFAGAPMVMHVSECDDTRIAVPFHVQIDGEWDRSRTWLVTRREGGLRLKHDHRHADGELDAVTMYGGDTAEAGSATTQCFPVDEESIALFKREGLTASVTNVWCVEVEPGKRFAYQLQRTKAGGAPEDRFFRVEFDLTKPVDPPPPAWGWE